MKPSFRYGNTGLLLSPSVAQPGGLPYTWVVASTRPWSLFVRGIKLFFEPWSGVFPEQNPQLSFKEKEDLKRALAVLIDGSVGQLCSPPARDERGRHH